jgi:hypothetical protein
MARTPLVPALFVALASLPALAAPEPERDEPGRLALVTERAIVFKDGTCLIVKKATGTSNAAGEVFTEEVPDAAVLGTFWATPLDGQARLVSFVASTKETEQAKSEKAPCLRMLELLSVNTGKKATLDLDDGKSLAGTISRVLARNESQPVPAGPYLLDAGRSSVPFREATSLSGDFVVVKLDDGGDVALPVSRIRSLRVAEMQAEIDRTTKTRSVAKRMTFRFEGGAADRALRIVYFRPGIRWIPTYRLQVQDLAPAGSNRGPATLRMQAELLDEAEDLVDVPIDVVAGVPNFRFKDTVSPLVLEGALRDALRQAAPQLMGQQALASNSFGSRAGEWREDAPAGGAFTLPADIATERSQDLYAYTLPKITLRRGERAAVPVFEAKVAYRDVYTWDVSLTRCENEGMSDGKGISPLTLSTQRVWHQIEIVNSTSVPWTTGAVLLEDARRPLAQDLLTYTSPGGAVRVPITVAMDLRPAVEKDDETGRKQGALRWLGWNYARIEKQAAFSVKSFLSEAADLEVVCRLGGAADTATDGGAISVESFVAADWVNYSGHPAVNNHSTVRWTTRLEPGKTFAPTLAYHFFVHE